MAALTSDDARLDAIVSRTTGFLYVVGQVGVTGARATLSEELPAFLARLRAKTELPLVVGFGISKREHVKALEGLADGAIVGAAMVDLVASTPQADRLEKVQSYVEVLTGREEASTTSR